MRFILVSLFFMGWVFWEMSGGSDFVPPSQQGVEVVASAEAAVPEVAPVPAAPDTAKVEPIATRSAVSPAVDGLSFATMQQPATEARVIPAAATKERQPRNVGEGTLKVMALPRVEPTEPVAEAPSVEPEKAAMLVDRDIRRVTGNSVNMRNGPGTRYDVTGRLNEGDMVEVLTDPGKGWVKLRVESTGRIGWMADFLLASAQ